MHHLSPLGEPRVCLFYRLSHFLGSSMYVGKSPKFSSLTVLNVWQWPMETGSRCICHYRTRSSLCFFLFWGSWPESELICWHGPRQHAPCVGSPQAPTRIWQSRQAGPSPVTPSHGLLPHSNFGKQTQASGRGSGCACQLGGGPQFEAWPPTVSEGAAQASLTVTVKLKGHTFK